MSSWLSLLNECGSLLAAKRKDHRWPPAGKLPMNTTKLVYELLLFTSPNPRAPFQKLVAKWLQRACGANYHLSS